MNQVRETTLSALANQDVPFNWVVKMLRPEHGSTHAPPFSVVFTLHNIPMPALEFSGLKLTTMESSRGVAPFDLNLNLLEYTDRITAALEYKTALFEPATIDRLLSQYEAILAKVVRSPRVSLREMDEMLRRLDRDAMSEKEAELEGLRQRQFKSVKRMRVTGS
jgi:non-ribosomal peptide synthetase component F